MKPFLILQLRDVDEACQNEFDAILHYGELKPAEVLRIRMEVAGIPPLNLQDYAGVIVGGGPSNISDPVEKKTREQIRFEKDLEKLLLQIVEKDFPFLGACYGLGAIAGALSSEVSMDKYHEKAGAINIQLTSEGQQDNILEGIPKSFRALTGHKEAWQYLPEGVKLLAHSDECPIQMIRYRENVYATQFHPEMDVEGLILRINVYKENGYFNLDEMESLKEQVSHESIVYPQKILKNFIAKYR